MVHRASSQLNEFGLKSPAKKCKTATPNTYPTVRKQVQFVGDNSFDDVEGSLLEEETRQAYQVADMRRVEESKKNEVEKSVNDETPTTPGKLSRMFEDSMRDSWPAPPTIHRGVEWSQFLNCSLFVCLFVCLFVLCLIECGQIF